MNTNDVITAFYQQGENDCTTIATIKTAIARFGIDSVFTSAFDNALGTFTITFKNGEVVSFTQDELNSLKASSGFAPNFGPTDALKKSIFDYAGLCFAAFVKNYAKQNSISVSSALADIDGTGIGANYAYHYLGFSDMDVTFLANNAGTRNPQDFANTELYLLYNDFHAVIASLDKYDEYGTPTSTNDFVKNHSKIIRGKRLWAYKFNT